jgi:hypothetical protein
MSLHKASQLKLTLAVLAVKDGSPLFMYTEHHILTIFRYYFCAERKFTIRLKGKNQ